jgi:hypothetical protein
MTRHKVWSPMVKLNSILIIQESSCWFNNKWYLRLTKFQPLCSSCAVYWVNLLVLCCVVFVWTK